MKKFVKCLLCLTFSCGTTAVQAQDTVTVEIPKSVYSLYDQGEPTGVSPLDRPSYQRSRDNMDMYPIHTDAQAQGNPQGVITEGYFTSETTYPGVRYKYWVYVPVQYDPGKPANLIVFLDGHDYLSNERDADAPTILDNLIAKGEIPVTVALFITPGDKGPGMPIYGGSGNRSVEYDSVDDRYARFLIEELMPVTVGEYNLSANPADRCIYGISSGANCALGVAWHRNDCFGKVILASGSFANIRGGHIWPFVIRSHEKKDIKAYLTVGELDLNIIFGDWVRISRDMAGAFKYRDYEHILTIHKSGHTGKVMHSQLPDILRWLWNGSEFTSINCEIQ